MSTDIEFVVVLSTCAHREEAERITQRILEERAAACVNIIDDVTSVYRWKGKIEETRECLLLVKTRRELATRVEGIIKELSSYECPEMIVLPILLGAPQYLHWLADATNPESGTRP